MKNMTQDLKVQHYSAIKKCNTNVSFMLISTVELDHRRSVAKTFVHKMGLYT